MTKLLKGYVLINATVGREKDVMKSLQELPGVKEIHLLAGEFDVLAELEFKTKLAPLQLFNSDEQIMAFITEKVRKVPGITRTRTVIPIAGNSEEKEQVEEKGKTRKGFVFVETTSGRESKVTKELIKIPEVREVHLITGSKDLLAVVWVQKYIYPYQAEIMEIVTNKIQKVKGIVRTDTFISEEARTGTELQAPVASF